MFSSVDNLRERLALGCNKSKLNLQGINIKQQKTIQKKINMHFKKLRHIFYMIFLRKLTIKKCVILKRLTNVISICFKQIKESNKMIR